MPAMSTILPSTTPVATATETPAVPGVAVDKTVGMASDNESFAAAFAQLQTAPVIALTGNVVATANSPTAQGDAATADGALGQWLGLVLPPDGTALPTPGQAQQAASAGSDSATAAVDSAVLAAADAMQTVAPPIVNAAPVAVTSAVDAKSVISASGFAAKQFDFSRQQNSVASSKLDIALSDLATATSAALGEKSSNELSARSEASLAALRSAVSSTASVESSAARSFESVIAAQTAGDGFVVDAAARGGVEHAATLATNHIAASDMGAGARVPAPIVATTVNTPVQHTQWAGEMSERVVYLVKNEIQHAEIRLNPAQLGPIEVRLTMQNDQAHLTFSASHGVTRDALEAALPKLRDMFADAGLTLGGASVTAESFGDAQKRDQPATAFANPDHRGDNAAVDSETGEDEGWRELALPPGQSPSVGLDLFA